MSRCLDPNNTVMQSPHNFTGNKAYKHSAKLWKPFTINPRAIFCISALPVLVYNTICIWQTMYRNSQLVEWIGHPQIPCIVKLLHALLVPTVWMYTLNIAEQNQTARHTPYHEIRTFSSFGPNMNIHSKHQFTSLRTTESANPGLDVMLWVTL